MLLLELGMLIFQDWAFKNKGDKMVKREFRLIGHADNLKGCLRTWVVIGFVRILLFDLLFLLVNYAIAKRRNNQS